MYRQLVQDRADKYKEWDAILVGAKKENRRLTAEEKEAVGKFSAAIEDLDAEIAIHEKLRDAQRKAPGREVEASATERPAAFKSFGEMLLAVRIAAMSDGHSVDPRLFSAAYGASEAVPSEGGFLIQPDVSAELLRKTYDLGALASRCRRIPISANANGLTVNAIDETTRATGSRWGGVQVYWADEADSATAKKPKFRQMNLKLKKLIGLAYITDELLQDARALEAITMQAFSEEFAFVLDDVILNGVGGAQPVGILNSGALVSVAAESGQVATTFIYENACKMYARLWSRSVANAAWFINQQVFPQLFTMSLPVGTGGVPVFLPPGGATGAPYATLFGRPVIVIEQAAALGTVGDVVLADLSQYLLIDKGPMEAASSIHVRFINNENTFRFTYRVDGQSVWNAVLTPYKGTGSTLSPFVALASR